MEDTTPQTPVDSSMSAIVESLETTDADKATPEAGAETAVAATEGGTTPETEPEVPAAFKEATPEAKGEEDGKPDLSLDKDLEGHPVLRAKWESYKAEKERGIDKFIQEHNDKLQTATKQLEEFEPLRPFLSGIEALKSGPESAWKELEAIEEALVSAYGPRPGAGTPTGDDGEPKSKYGLDFPTDDKVVDVVLTALDKKLEERLGPIADRLKTEDQRKEAETKATSAVATLKAEFELSSDPWVTKEMVTAAMDKFPALDPTDAFKAMYAVEIGRYYAKHAGAKQTVRNLPQGGAGARQVGDLPPGSTMLDILQVEQATANLG